MNKAYRLIWSKAKERWVVAAEIIKGNGGPSPITVAAAVVTSLIMAASGAFALPSGGQVAAGQAAISTPATNQMNITQGTNQAIINWNSFGIGKGEAVNIAQPSSQSTLLNRVLGNNPSNIFGSLTANGRVFLTNPSGILFAPGASVNVGGLVASSLSIKDSDFLAGKYSFFKDGAGGSVVNQGNVSGGFVALLGNSVENAGTIVTTKGTTGLAAGDEITLGFDPNGLMAIKVDKAAYNAQVTNSGVIEADGGTVVMTASAADALLATVVNNSGKVRARSMVERNGEIVIEGGNVTNSGTLDVSGKSTLTQILPPLQGEGRGGDGVKGGTITLSGDHITLASGSLLDATGKTGGGTVLVGGGWQGSGTMHQATTVTMEQGAKIDVSATQIGNGGTAVLWSDIHNANSITTVGGEILSKGGAEGGDGGWVETSGEHFTIQEGAQVKAKKWLIDPVNITIDSTLASTIGTALGTGNVTITTNGGNTPSTTSGESGTDGDITVSSAISWTSAYSLTLSAYRNIAINANITATNGNVSLYYGQGAVAAGNTATYNFGLTGTLNNNTGNNFTGQINLLEGERFSTKLGSDGALVTYRVVNYASSFQAMINDTVNNYALGSNISLNSIANWVAIGNSATQFTKKFDGLGHSVSNLTINRPTEYNQGLFGRTNSSASIKNIGITSGSITASDSAGGLLGLNTGSSIVSDSYAAVNVSGANGTGGLVGYNMSGTISNAYATGSVTATGAYTGGFVGNNGGTVSNSYSTGTVSGASMTGGFVGYDTGTISKSYSTGSVTATGSSAGGFVGQSSGIISNSYSTGNVTSSTTYVGGFSGQGGTISNCYSTGSATSTGSGTGGYYVGGFVGNNGTISNSYSTGSVSSGSTSRKGGFSGYTGGTITNSFWDNQTSGMATSGGAAVGKTTAQMKTLSTFTNAGWSITGADGAYPTLTFGATPWRMGSSTTSVTINFTSALSSIYGDTPPSGTISSGYTLVGSSNLTLSYGSFLTSTTAAGSYSYASNPTLLSIGYTSGSASDYSITWGTNSSYTVSPRPINITVNSGQTKVYGAANPAYTYAVEAAGSSRGRVNNDTFIGALARVAGEDVDTYAINSVGTLANSNYAITVVPANFAVTQAPLTVTASAQSKTYGDILTMGNTTDTNLFTSSGLQNGETIGRLTLASSGAVDTAGVSGSPYSIVPSNATNGTFMASNYSITYVNGALTVNRAPLTIGATGQSKNYGTTLNLGTTGFSPAGLKNTDTIGGVTLSSSGAMDTAARGTYTITPSAATGGTFDSNNYNITYSNGNLTVDRAPLTVTANNASKTYDGAALPGGGNGVTYSGFVLGQGASDLPGALDYSTGSSSGAVNAGSYTIRPSGYTAGNYSYTYVDGTLTIAQRPITLTADAQTKVYGNADPSLTYAMEAAGTGRGRVGTDTFTGSLSRTAGETVAGGPYAIAQGTVANSNYAIAFVPANLSITQRPITLTASAASKVYGENEPTLAVTVTGGSLATVAQNDAMADVSGTLSREAGSNVGSYDIALGTGAKAANYAITFTTDIHQHHRHCGHGGWLVKRRQPHRQSDPRIRRDQRRRRRDVSDSAGNDDQHRQRQLQHYLCASQPDYRPEDPDAGR